MSPPKAATRWRAIARPRPVPPASRAVVKKRSNTRSLLPGDTAPVIRRPRPPRRLARRDRDAYRRRRPAVLPGILQRGSRARCRMTHGRSRRRAGPRPRPHTFCPCPRAVSAIVTHGAGHVAGLLAARHVRASARASSRMRRTSRSSRAVSSRMLARNLARSSGGHLLEMVAQELGAAADAGERRLELVADAERQLAHIVGARLQGARHDHDRVR